MKFQFDIHLIYLISEMSGKAIENSRALHYPSLFKLKLKYFIWITMFPIHWSSMRVHKTPAEYNWRKIHQLMWKYSIIRFKWLESDILKNHRIYGTERVTALLESIKLDWNWTRFDQINWIWIPWNGINCRIFYKSFVAFNWLICRCSWSWVWI